MLAYVLALAVGLGSLAVYMAAFFFPEIHRKSDFVWSGLGLFYALVLWVCAGRITGGVLLGQVAGVALLGWSVTQALQLRREITPRQQQTELPSASEVKKTVEEKVSNLSSQQLSPSSDRPSGILTGVKDFLQQKLSAFTQRQSKSSNAPALERDQNNQKVQIVDNRTPISAKEQLTPDTESATEKVADAEIEPALSESEAIELAVENTLAEDATPEASPGVSEPVRPHPPAPEIVEAAIHDAEEKHEKASPPDTEPPKNP
jgi:hypothetical protein